MKKLEKGQKFWCWWLSRYLWFVEKKPGEAYIFEDVAGAKFELSRDERCRLKEDKK